MDRPDRRAELLGLATGYWRAGVVYALARVGIADLLASGPRDAASLAEAAGLRHDPLARFLRAAASLGLLASDPAGGYRLTPLGELLRQDVPGSLRDNVISIVGWQREAWRHDALEDALTGPGPGGWRALYEAPWFEWLQARPEEMVIFQRGQAARHGQEPAAFIATYDLAPHRVAMDIGGGNGALLSVLLAAAPHLSGVLVDQPAAIAAAERGEGGALPRCRLVAHDFFSPLPVSADLILLKHVIHDWEDEDAIRILANARAALDPGPASRVLVLDAVLAEGDAPDPVKLLDLHMMLLPGGRQRSEAEFATIFAAAGLRLAEIRQILPGLAIVAGSAA